MMASTGVDVGHIFFRSVRGSCSNLARGVSAAAPATIVDRFRDSGFGQVWQESAPDIGKEVDSYHSDYFGGGLCVPFLGLDGSDCCL